MNSNLAMLKPHELAETQCTDNGPHRWFMTPIVQFTLDFACNRCGRCVYMGWATEYAGLGFADIYEYARLKLGADFVPFTSLEQLREDFADIIERMDQSWRKLALDNSVDVRHT